MDSKQKDRPLDSVGNGPWYEEFGLIPRFPRPPLKQISELIESAKELEIFLTASDQSVDIVIRMTPTSNTFLLDLAKRLDKLNVTLAQAFDDILWEKLGRRKNKVWTEITKLAMEAYFDTWNHWADLQYLGHFHPAADEMYKRIKQGIQEGITKAKRGKKSVSTAELASLEKRFAELLPQCELMHKAAQDAASSARAKNNVELSRKEIRRAIWNSVRSEFHGMPGDGYIFSGEAFEKMGRALQRRSRRVKPSLHDPDTWEPYQLAICLLSRERSLAYETTQKRLQEAKRGMASSKGTHVIPAF